MNGLSAAVESQVHTHTMERSEVTVTFGQQVAGHSKEKGSSRPGMLKHADGSLLKPILGPPRGPRELGFYEDVFNVEGQDVDRDAVRLELRKLIPDFRGFLRIDPESHGFLKMEDVTENLTMPCILDAKMGGRTYDEEASPDKIFTENEKYKGTKTLGFCIPGMRVHQVSTNKNLCYGKEFGKQLNKDTVKDAFRLFLNSDCPASVSIVDSFLHQLNEVRRWFQRQNKYVFYASSLLLVYDAALLISVSSSANGHRLASTQRITDVRMIDFAHVFPSTTIDHNYLNGLNNLIALLEELRVTSSR